MAPSVQADDLESGEIPSDEDGDVMDDALVVDAQSSAAACDAQVAGRLGTEEQALATEEIPEPSRAQQSEAGGGGAQVEAHDGGAAAALGVELTDAATGRFREGPASEIPAAVELAVLAVEKQFPLSQFQDTPKASRAQQSEAGGGVEARDGGAAAALSAELADAATGRFCEGPASEMAAAVEHSVLAAGKQLPLSQFQDTPQASRAQQPEARGGVETHDGGAAAALSAELANAATGRFCAGPASEIAAAAEPSALAVEKQAPLSQFQDTPESSQSQQPEAGAQVEACDGGAAVASGAELADAATGRFCEEPASEIAAVVEPSALAVSKQLPFAQFQEKRPLNRPLWVQFFDMSTGRPYFYNTRTHLRLELDPDPAGDFAYDDHLAPEATDGDDDEAPVFGPAFEETKRGDQVEAAADGEVDGLSLQGPWWERPARVQKDPEPSKHQYIEGSEHFNLWFGKYENDRFDPKQRDVANGRCDPALDSGWTMADVPDSEMSYYCVFFAMGGCNLGSRCGYYHHLPIEEECDMYDMVHDIFGRQRYATHRDDMGGVGCFNTDGKTIFVGDLIFDRTAPDAVEKMERELRRSFGVWGRIEHIRIIPRQAIAFVRYAHRGFAEFAKMAMSNQRLGRAKCIRVRWANADRNPKAAKVRRKEIEDQVDEAAGRKMERMNLSEVDIAGLMLSHQNKAYEGVTAPYPDTSAQYPAATAARQRERLSKRAVEVAAEYVEAEAHAAKLRKVASDQERLASALARVAPLVSAVEAAAACEFDASMGCSGGLAPASA